jgi:hypothetical protein
VNPFKPSLTHLIVLQLSTTRDTFVRLAGQQRCNKNAYSTGEWLISSYTPGVWLFMPRTCEVGADATVPTGKLTNRPMPRPTAVIRLVCVMSYAFLLVTCTQRPSELTTGEREQIAREIRAQVIGAYDLGRPGAVDRLMSLYPATGPVYSAGAGRFSTSRDSLATGIEEFWENVGQNMQQARWEWTAMHIDVLSSNSAVMTATYRVPHLTPRGEPHVIGGAWTAVFANRGGRWVILHEHLSDMPVIPDSVARAVTDTSHDAHTGN